ncbi:Aste57867_18582 [Aphanomyces stellatus]|uniref:Aste57867_18582 protein n=1 Tax=Aphanomyces stellatus TaxID=120398 RepID=A0A485LBZ2_9STRA|nr:hypothetical protein As57867_018520 [Aphanomyces stellatus]VFT95317.1 Aste57867_18582 [Aphanomyces stellatus]
MASSSPYQISLEPDKDGSNYAFLAPTTSMPFLDYDTLMQQQEPPSPDPLASDDDGSAVSAVTVDISTMSGMDQGLFRTFDACGDAALSSESPTIDGLTSQLPTLDDDADNAGLNLSAVDSAIDAIMDMQGVVDVNNPVYAHQAYAITSSTHSLRLDALGFAPTPRDDDCIPEYGESIDAWYNTGHHIDSANNEWYTDYHVNSVQSTSNETYDAPAMDYVVDVATYDKEGNVDEWSTPLEHVSVTEVGGGETVSSPSTNGGKMDSVITTHLGEDKLQPDDAVLDSMVVADNVIPSLANNGHQLHAGMHAVNVITDSASSQPPCLHRRHTSHDVEATLALLMAHVHVRHLALRSGDTPRSPMSIVVEWEFALSDVHVPRFQYDVTVQVGVDDVVTTVLDSVPLDQLVLPATTAVHLPTPPAWFRLGLSSTSHELDTYFAAWASVDAPSTGIQPTFTSHAASDLAMQWAWPSALTKASFIVDVRRHQPPPSTMTDGGEMMDADECWHRVFDGRGLCGPVSVTLPDVPSNVQVQVRLTLVSIERHDAVNVCGMLWLAPDDASSSHSALWSATYVAVTAPSPLVVGGFAGSWWLDPSPLPRCISHNNDVVDGPSLAIDTAIVGTDQVTQQTWHQPLPRSSLKLGVVALAHVRPGHVYTIHLERTYDHGIATSLSVVVDVSAHSHRVQWTCVDATPLLTWAPVPMWLTNHIDLCLERYAPETDDWLRVSDATAGAVHAAALVDMVGGSLTDMAFRLAAYATDRLMDASTTAVVVTQPLVTSVAARGLGQRTSITWRGARLASYLNVRVARYCVCVDDREQVVEPNMQSNDTYTLDWTFDERTTAVHTVAIDAVLESAAKNDLLVTLSAPPPPVTYLAGWPAIELKLGVVTHDAATCELHVPQWSRVMTSTIQCQVEVWVHGAWVLQWYKQLRGKDDDDYPKDVDHAAQSHRVAMTNLPCHTVVPVRVLCRVQSTHPWETVSSLQCVTACGGLAITTDDVGALHFEWTELAGTDTTTFIGAIAYAIQCFNATTNGFDTMYTATQAPFMSPPLEDRPLHLLTFRIQTHVECQIPLDGVPQIALTNPAAPDTHDIQARYVVLHYKPLHRASLPSVERRRSLESGNIVMSAETTAVTTKDHHLGPTTSVLDHVITADFKVLGVCKLRPLCPHTAYATRLVCTYHHPNGCTLRATSPWVYFITAIAAPDPPSSLVVHEQLVPYVPSIPHGHLHVQWSESDDNGAPVRGYALEMRWATPCQDDETAWHGVYVGPALSFRPTAAQLQTMRRPLQTVVTFRVQAANELGLCYNERRSEARACVGVVDPPSSQQLRRRPEAQQQLLPPLTHKQQKRQPKPMPLVHIQHGLSPCQQYMAARDFPYPPSLYQAERRQWYMEYKSPAKTTSATAQACALYQSTKKTRKNRVKESQSSL